MEARGAAGDGEVAVALEEALNGRGRSGELREEGE